MMTEKIAAMLIPAGYERMRTDRQEITIYQKTAEDTGWLLLVITITQEPVPVLLYQRLIQAGETSLYHKGCRKVYTMVWFVAEMALQNVPDPGCPYWIIDPDTRRLIVYEDQPVDFDGLYEPLDRLVSTREPAWWQRIPRCTGALVGINIVIFLIMFISNPAMDLEHMMKYGAMHTLTVLRDHEYYRLFTSMFLHFDFSHIFNNMLLLYFAGGQLERQMGSTRFLLLYLLSGLCGNLLSFYDSIRNYSMAVSAGASGAVYGVLGALLVIVLLHKGRIREMTGRRLTLLLVGSLYYGFADTGIDNMAHLGGAISGMILALLLYYVPVKLKGKTLQEE